VDEVHPLIPYAIGEERRWSRDGEPIPLDVGKFRGVFESMDSLGNEAKSLVIW
jgi:hypothetical protein